MKLYEYQEKDSKEKSRAVDILSLIQDISDLEEFNGLTERKLAENWYELKRQLRDALLVELKGETAK